MAWCTSVPFPPTEPRRGSVRGARRSRGDAGQTTVLAAIVVVVGVLLTIGVARLGSVAIDRARARTAADAAALAAAIEEPLGSGRRTAEAVAHDNGAIVESYRVDGTTVEVSVRVGTARATSRADRVRVGSDRPRATRDRRDPRVAPTAMRGAKAPAGG